MQLPILWPAHHEETNTADSTKRTQPLAQGAVKELLPQGKKEIRTQGVYLN